MLKGMPYTAISDILFRVEGRRIPARSLSRHYTRHLAPVLARMTVRREIDWLLQGMLARAMSEG